MSFGAFSSFSAPKCRLCGCPVVDGGVALSTVDGSRLSRWWRSSRGISLQEETIRDAWICMNCVRAAKRDYEFSCEKDDHVWWPEVKDPIYKYFLVDGLKSCSVPLKRLRDEEVFDNPQLKSALIFDDIIPKIETPCELENNQLQSTQPKSSLVSEHIILKIETPCELEDNQLQSPQPSSSLVFEHIVPKEETPNELEDNQLQSPQPNSSLVFEHIVPKVETPYELEINQLQSTQPKSSLVSEYIIPKIETPCELEDNQLQIPQPNSSIVFEHIIPKVETETLNELENNQLQSPQPKSALVLDHNYPKIETPCELEDNQLPSPQPKSSLVNCDRIIPTIEKHLQTVSKKSKPHSIRKTQGNPVACQICRIVVSKKKLKSHLSSSCPKRKPNFKTLLFQCPLCKFESQTKTSVTQKHIVKHHKPKMKDVTDLTCSLCHKKYPTERKLEDHYCKDKKKVTCSHCNISMYKEYLLAHQVKEWCMYCKKMIACANLMERHYQDLRPCPWCKPAKLFCTDSNLEKHTDRIHRKFFTYWKGLEYKEANLRCFKCRTFFENSAALSEHTIVHDMEKTDGHTCEFCLFKALNKKYLVEHLNAVHSFVESAVKISTGDENKKVEQVQVAYFQCTECNCKFSRQDLLENHLMMKHSIFAPRKNSQTSHTPTKLKDQQQPSDDNIMKVEFCFSTHFDDKAQARNTPPEVVTKTYLVALQDPSESLENEFIEITARAHTLNRKIVIQPYKCSYCTASFPSKRKMVNHLEVGHRVGNFERTCSNCKTSFADNLNRKNHFCPGKFKTACSLCNLFMYPEFLVAHNIPTTCITCNEEFSCETQLLTHQDRVSFCGICGKKFCSEDKFLKHCLKVHKFEGRDAMRCVQFANNGHECRKCGYFYETAAKLERHKQLKHFEYVACEFCARLFLDSASLRDHYVKSHRYVESRLKPSSTLVYDVYLEKQRLRYKRTTVPSTLKETNDLVSFSCLKCYSEQCNMVFKRKLNADMHVVEMHMSSYAIGCPLCDFWTLTHASLQAHLSHFHLLVPKVVPRIIGWNSLLYGDSIKNFLVRPQVLLHFCGICDFTASDELALKNHFDEKHLWSQEYLCPFCHMSFTDCYLFKQHKDLLHSLEQQKRFHLKERSHDCEECALDFATSADWMEHWELCHQSKAQNPPTNAYECVFCGLECATKTAAMEHVALFKHL